MTKDKNKFYVTTAIDYASGAPHIGHAYEKIAADVLARWNRDLKRDVYFQTGVDEHGQKIVDKAKEIGKEPQDFVDFISRQFENLIKRLNISCDYFIRTTDENHKKVIQEVLQKVYDKGDIYKAKYDGLYCVGCERYYSEEELIDGKICPDHKKEVEKKSEENYFFRLSKYQDKLLDFYEKNPSFIAPENKQKEILNRVREGLNDISISRPKSSLLWGIELPFDKTHVSYVWFDALFNYYSGTVINDNGQWPCDVHIIGHDISWFHVVYWPAFLMSAGLDLPKQVFSHAMILDGEGHKMSKSLGNVIDPIKFSKKYGVDEFRYFLMAASSFGEDVYFSEEKFVEKINNELNNDLGNLVSRVHAMVGKYFDGVVVKKGKLEKIDEDLIERLDFFDEFNLKINDLKFNQALDVLWSRIRDVNAYVNKVSPWKEESKERLATIMAVLVGSCVLFAKYFNCFMPNKAAIFFKQFNIQNDLDFKFKFLDDNHKLAEKVNLFEKIKLEKKEKTEQDKIKGIIFDFDGVIHNTFDLAFKLHKIFNPNSTKEYYKTYFDGNIFSKVDKDYNQKEHDKFRELEYEEFKNLKLEKSIKKELEKLSKKYELFIISSNTETNLNMYFENNNFIGIFKEILASETHKSKQEKFKILFKKYNLDNKNSIFVTDTLGDIKEANKIGIKTIAVDFGFHERERLEKGNPFKIVSSFKQIRKIVDKLSNSNLKQEEIKREGFSKLNLKVGKIISIENHPNSDKMFLEQIDVGEEKPRQIVSGLKPYYSLEEIRDKKVVVVCNIKPVKLRGEKSEGMVLAADNEDENLVGLLTSNAKVGTYLECDGEKADNSNRIKIDDFFTIEMISDGETVTFNGREVKAGDEKINIDRGVKGKVC